MHKVMYFLPTVHLPMTPVWEIYSYQACTFAKDDSKCIPNSYDVGTRGCAGMFECQFESMEAAKDFCDSGTTCTAIVLHPRGMGFNHCESWMDAFNSTVNGCFTPRQGPPSMDASPWCPVGGQIFVKKCSIALTVMR